jgi:membrane protein YdbS with pleckstrin-like domain
MAELTIRPTRKRIIAGYLLCLLVCGAWLWVYAHYLSDKPQWLAALALVVFLWPLAKDAGARFETLELDGGRLRYKSGLTSVSTRLLDVSKIRDVHVEQGPLNRMLGIGTVSVQTQGEDGCIRMDDVDHPAQVAEKILDACQRYSRGGGGVKADA